ncbi:hypothetical protein PWT90_03907 [Aphanocladium album]|nr:hypothetical protein PWT90_03907 [Aphanocladium album]
MPPKRAKRAAPASTAPERMQTRRAARSRQSEPAANTGRQDNRMVTRGSSAKPSSSTPRKGEYSLTQDPIARRGARGGVVDVRSDPHDGSEDEEYELSVDEHVSNAEEKVEVAPVEEHEDEDAEASAEEQEDEEEDAHGADAEEEDEGPIVEVSDEDVQFMSDQVVKVAGAAEGILSTYKPFTNKDNIARRTFEMDMAGLGPMRKFFIVQQGYGEFLQWTWLRGRKNLPVDVKEGFKTALILINLATLLEVIYTGAKNNLNEAGAADLEALEILDNNFKDLMLASDRPVTQPIVEFALHVRVARLLAKLARAPTNDVARRFAYEIFCGGKIKEPTARQIRNYSSGYAYDIAEDDIKEILIMDQIDEGLRNGPYKAAAGIASDEVNHRCRSHISAFLKHISKNKASFSNLAAFRRKYPARDLLASIQSMYNDLAQPMREASRDPEEGRGAEDEEFHDAADQISLDSDSEDEVESQEIVRATDTQAGTSHFTGAADLQLLARSRPSAPPPPPPPPSNQQASSSRGSRRTLPVNHNATTLTSPSSRRRHALATSPQSSPQRLAALPNRKRTNSQVDNDYVPAVGGHDDNDDEDDDDDVFETDTRRLSEASRLAKRQRLEAKNAARVEQHLRAQQAQQQIQHWSPPRHYHPPLSSATTAVGGLTQRPEHTMADLRAIEIEKRRSSQARGRSTASSSARVPPSSSMTSTALTHAPSRTAAALSIQPQRHRWSDHDSQVLIRSIERHFCKWSAIEKQDNHLFERPRDQQAYRDRARNMKVDFLINDVRLPPCFNLVIISAKEKLRIIGLGKNPYRTEADVDMVTGRVINTEFVPERAPSGE